MCVAQVGLGDFHQAWPEDDAALACSEIVLLGLNLIDLVGLRLVMTHTEVSLTQSDGQKSGRSDRRHAAATIKHRELRTLVFPGSATGIELL